MLPWWRSIFETLKAQEKNHKDKAGEEDNSPTAPPVPLENKPLGVCAVR